ncbi:MAG: peroxiredoxin [Phycisphaeraceae bacterium]|nr:MAG: peroxiredoxin [Phycisphaeraceae bacterium]
MHEFAITTEWTGAGEEGTATYKSYTRDYDISADGKPTLKGSAAPAYKGDPARHNPEDLFVASASGCHMLSYLHLCAVSKVVVTGYTDDAVGRLATDASGSGVFEEIVLRPRVTIAAGSDAAKAEALHEKAGEICFIARSLACPVRHEPTIVAG